MTEHLLTTPDETTSAAIELEIGCECGGHDGLCEHPADLWIIIHDLTHEDAAAVDGNSSMYVCAQCWMDYIEWLDDFIIRAASLGKVAACRCGLVIRCRTAVVYKVQPIRGTKR